MSYTLTPAGARDGAPWARDLTPPGSFTGGAEGPATGPDGSVYAVNAVRDGTVGRLAPDGTLEVFAELPRGSVGNGIRVAPDGRCLYVADYTGHAVLRVELDSRRVTTHAAHASLHQPNDLAITGDGTLFASDPDWPRGTGRVWRVSRSGAFEIAIDSLGTTNGIEVAPDGRTLYVNESLQRRIWAFRLGPGGELSDQRLFAELPDFGLDGMRFGPDGLLYVARYGKGTIARFHESGEPAGELRVLGAACTNLTFVESTCVVTSADRRNLQGINITTCMIR